jgi:hypothetical protein
MMAAVHRHRALNLNEGRTQPGGFMVARLLLRPSLILLEDARLAWKRHVS